MLPSHNFVEYFFEGVNPGQKDVEIQKIMLGRKFIGIVTNKGHDNLIEMVFLDPMENGEDFVINKKIAKLYPEVKPNIIFLDNRQLIENFLSWL
jgi:hypothetical protein